MWPNPFAKIESMIRGKIDKIKASVSKAYESAKTTIVNTAKRIDKATTGSGDKNEGKQGGYDFRSDLRKDGPHPDTKRKGGKNVEVVDVTGFDAASSLSGGLTNNKAESFADFALKTRDGLYKGDNVSAVKQEANEVTTFVKQTLDSDRETKSDTTVIRHYGGEKGTLQTTVKKVEGK